MKFTIRAKILITILGILLLSIATVVSLNIYTINDFSTTSSDTVFETMKDEELANLDRISEDRSLLLGEYFDALTTDLTVAFEFADALFNGRITMDPFESFWADEVIDSKPTKLFIEDHFGFGEASWDVSTVFMPGIDTALEYQSISGQDLQLIDQSSSLDYVFKTLHASNPNYIWLYMGFESNDLYRQLPYNDMSWAREGGDYYVATEQNWYTDAVEKDGLNIFLDKDPEIPEILFVTASYPIKTDGGDLVGVISIDLVLEAMEEVISGETILDNGYSYLIDTEGNTLIHPILLEDPERFGESIIELEFAKTSVQDLNKFFAEISAVSAGRVEIKKGSSTWLLSFSDVAASDFVVIVAVPLSDVLAPAKEIEDKINSILIQRILLFLLIAFILGVAVFTFASYSSKKIVRPVHELTEVTKLISEGNLTQSLSNAGSGSREINLLYTTFQGLITALRFGNQDYYAGDINRAMENYQNALTLFQTLNNEKGIGICYNNIGNIHRAKGNLKDANQAYKTSLDIAIDLFDKNTGDDTSGLIYSLASRYNNLGLLYMDIEQFDLAIDHMNKALEMDKKIDNARGFSTRYGNLGQIYLMQKKMKQAKEAFDESFEIAKSLDSDRALAYSYLNYGLYAKASNDANRALDMFIRASELATDIDVRIIITSLKNMEEIYRAENLNAQAEEIKTKLDKISRSSRTKEVTFVLDYSGSMSGRRMTSAIRGIKNIFKGQINDDDRVGLILFDTITKMAFPPTQKGGSIKKFMLMLDKLKHPNGGTALYDALGEALNDFLSRPRPDEQWVIALTDGEDNSSRRYGPKQLFEMASKTIGVNIVIVGVGKLENRSVLEKLCNATDRGSYIDVKDGVADAIESAFEEISTMLAEIVVEGFVPDN